MRDTLWYVYWHLLKDFSTKSYKICIYFIDVDKFTSNLTTGKMIRRLLDSYFSLADGFNCPNPENNIRGICATDNNEMYAFDLYAENKIGTTSQLQVMEPSKSDHSDFEDTDNFVAGLRE